MNKSAAKEIKALAFDMNAADFPDLARQLGA